MARLKRRRLRGSVTQNSFASRSPYGGRRTDTALWLQPLLRIGLLVLAGCLMIGFIAWLFRSGWPDRQLAALENTAISLTRLSGFAIRDVMVEGRAQTPQADILAALDVKTGAPLFGFAPASAHARIMQLPWVAAAIVERRLPDAIYVQLTERQPLARWQRGGKIVLIDDTGRELPGAEQPQFAKLPLIVGADAHEHAAEFLTQLRRHPLTAIAMQAAVRVSERRWDLYLQPKVIVRLPEKNLATALERLAGLIQDQRVLERNIAAIDLRMLPDRIIIEEAKPDKPEPGRKGDKP
jgi:cell division protein FtsQ